MPKRDDLIHQIFEGESTGPSRAAEARLWQSVKADLKAMKNEAPECQVTFDHLEGRLYAQTVRSQPRSFWIPAAAAGCLVLGAAYVFGLQMGRQNSVIPTVAMATPSAEMPGAVSDLRNADIEELIPAPEAPAAAVAPPSQEAPSPQAAPAARAESKPAKSPAVSAPARRKSSSRTAASPPKPVVASAPMMSEAAKSAEGQDSSEPGPMGGGGGGFSSLAGGSAPVAAMSPASDEMDSAPAVVVVPSIPRGRSGAPVAIENPVMGDLVFGG
jgi:ribosomal protein L12E/L44/L45/RPP1/RPP2